MFITEVLVWRALCWCLRYFVNPLQQHNHLHTNTQNHLNDIHKEELLVNQQFTVQHTNAFLPFFLL